MIRSCWTRNHSYRHFTYVEYRKGLPYAIVALNSLSPVGIYVSNEAYKPLETTVVFFSCAPPSSELRTVVKFLLYIRRFSSDL